MDVLNLLNRLDTYLQECSHLPLVGKIIVDEDEVFDLIDALQAAIPQEFERANWVLKEREQILREARKEAQDMIKDAQSQIATQASEHIIAKEAREQAEHLVAQAQSVAEEIHFGARQYADDLMKTVQDLFEEMLVRIKDNRRELDVTNSHNDDSRSVEIDNQNSTQDTGNSDDRDSWYDVAKTDENVL